MNSTQNVTNVQSGSGSQYPIPGKALMDALQELKQGWTAPYGVKNVVVSNMEFDPRYETGPTRYSFDMMDWKHASDHLPRKLVLECHLMNGTKIRFSLITFNVLSCAYLHHFVNGDAERLKGQYGRVLEQSSLINIGRKTNYREKVIANWLLQQFSNADEMTIVCLQEVSNEQFYELQKVFDFGEQKQFRAFRTTLKDDNNISGVIIVKNVDLDIHSSEQVKFDEKNNNNYVHSIIFSPKSSPEARIRICNTHVPFGKGGRLTEILKNMKITSPDVPMITCGDFNHASTPQQGNSPTIEQLPELMFFLPNGMTNLMVRQNCMTKNEMEECYNFESRESEYLKMTSLMSADSQKHRETISALQKKKEKYAEKIRMIEQKISRASEKMEKAEQYINETRLLKRSYETYRSLQNDVVDHVATLEHDKTVFTGCDVPVDMDGLQIILE